MQKNSKPEDTDFIQQDYYTKPERLKKRGATTPSSGYHTISRRQDNTIDAQVNVLSSIARTFNECLCGAPPLSAKGNHTVM